MHDENSVQHLKTLETHPFHITTLGIASALSITQTNDAVISHCNK